MTDSPQQQFWSKWLPIVARHVAGTEKREAPVEWFHNVGLAQSYPFVVRVWPRYGRLEEPDPDSRYGGKREVAIGYEGLVVEVHEHGVGKLIEEWFLFDQFLQSKITERPLNPSWQKFFVEEASLSETAPPGLSWHVYTPANICELLDPVERYIELWLSGNS